MPRHSFPGPGMPNCVPILGLPPGGVDGQALVYDSNSPLMLRWGDPLKGDKGDPGKTGPQGPPGQPGQEGIQGLSLIHI